MSGSRLSLALERGALALPEGRLVLLNAPGTVDLAGLDPARLLVEQDFYPEYRALQARGLEVTRQAEGRFAAAIVYLPRAKALARALVARAVELTGGGLVVVDGQKSDGIAALVGALRGRVTPGGSLSKAHGKLVWFEGGDLADWRAGTRRIEGGFVTRPGVFSADAPDPGSVLLAAALPADLAGRGADLGAGWGYLARAALARGAVERLDLVEASHGALECARENLADPRAVFHWADARDWRPAGLLDFVITNPPFHAGRRGDPGLGGAFIAAAAAMLVPRGRLLMVANRHLPYETVLEGAFGRVEEIGAPAGTGPAFKLLRATNPRRKRANMR